MPTVTSQESFLTAALSIKAPMPPSLLGRIWRHSVAAREWRVAATVVANPGLEATVRADAATVANTQVRTALLGREDMDAGEAFRICAGETRTSVLATLSRFRSDCPEDYHQLLAAALRSHATIGTAKLLLDAADSVELHAVDRDVAHPVLMVLSASGASSLTRHQEAVVRLWVAAMRGDQASTLLATPGIDALIGRASEAMMWLLLAGGREDAAIRGDTAAWLGRIIPADLTTTATSMLGKMSRFVGATATVTVIADAMLTAVAAAGQAAEVTDMTQTVERALTRPATGQMSTTFCAAAVRDVPPDALVTLTADGRDVTDVIAAAEALLAPLAEVPPRTDGRIRVVPRYDGPPAEHDAARMAVAAAIAHPHPQVSARGWILAGRYQLRMDADLCHDGWHRHAHDPDVAAALLSLWHSTVGFCALPTEAVAGIAGATVGTDRLSPGSRASHLYHVQARAVDELVRRGQYGAVPWQILSVAVRAGEDLWRVPVRVAWNVPGAVTAWMAARIETANDPDTLWTVVESIGTQFAGTLGDLLAAACDSVGERLDLGAPVSATPVALDTC